MSHQLDNQIHGDTVTQAPRAEIVSEIPQVRKVERVDTRQEINYLDAVTFHRKLNRNGQRKFKPKRFSLRDIIEAQKLEVRQAVKSKIGFVEARSNPKLLSFELSRGGRHEMPSLKGKFTGNGSFAFWDLKTAYLKAEKLIQYEKIGGKRV